MKRIEALDALRGIAATAVVLSHIHKIFFTHHIFLDLTPLRIFWAGGEAVVLFFVLSGFVLSAPFCHNSNVVYFRFIISRLTRIYLPFLASIGFALLLLNLHYDAATALPITYPSLLDHAILIGEFNTNTYNYVIWTLVHEMRFAIIFPFFIWMLNIFSWQSNVIITGFFSVCAALATSHGYDPSQGYNNSWLFSLHYLLFFMMGGLLVKNIHELGQRIKDLHSYQVKFILIGGLTLFVYSIWIYSFVIKMKWTELAQLIPFISDWCIGIASIIFIVFAIHNGKVSAFLHNKIFLFLGKISFSLYLVHAPILALALRIFANTPKIYAVAIALPFVFIIALVFHKVIEAPAHQLGRRLFQQSLQKLVSAA